VLHSVIDSETCVDIVCKYNDPAEAARALVRESSKHWTSKSDYMDDITAVVVFLTDFILPEMSVGTAARGA